MDQEAVNCNIHLLVNVYSGDLEWSGNESKNGDV
jgi:hypothetical protein